MRRLAPRVKSDLFSHEDNSVAIVAAGYAVELVDAIQIRLDGSDGRNAGSGL